MGTARVWIDEEKYYYLLEPGTATPQFDRVGAYLWRYQGQAIFSLHPSGPEGGVWREQSLAAGGLDRVPPVESVLAIGRATRVDSFGRLWVLASIDEDALARRLARYDETAMLPGQYGREIDLPSRAFEQRFVPFLPVDDTIVFGSPAWFTYDVTYCDSEWRVANWYEDDLDRQSWPLSEWGVKVLFLQTSSNGVCTATYMGEGDDGEGYVLTAAHCVLDESNSYKEKDTNSMQACALTGDAAGDAGECRDVTDIVCHGDYKGYLDQEGDWAVLRLDGTLSVGSMYLSKRTTSLTNWIARTRGFPSRDAQALNCDMNDPREQYGAKGDIAGVNYSATNFFLSTARGMSGGPMYYCWTGSCSDGAGQTSIVSYWTGLSVNGPRSADFRSEVAGALS